MSARVLKWFFMIGLFGICGPMQLAGQSPIAWAKTGGAAGYDCVTDLLVLEDNSVLASVIGSSGGEEMFMLIRIAQDGTVLWQSELDYPGAIETPNNLVINSSEEIVYVVGNVGLNNQIRAVAYDIASGSAFDNSDSWTPTTPVNSGLSARIFMDTEDSIFIYAADGDNLMRFITDTIGELLEIETYAFPELVANPSLAITADANFINNNHIIAGTTLFNYRAYFWVFEYGEPGYYIQLPTDSVIISSIGFTSNKYVQLTGHKYDSSEIYIALFDTVGGLFNFVLDTLIDLGPEKTIAGQAQRNNDGEIFMLYTLNPGTDFSSSHLLGLDDFGDVFFNIQLVNKEVRVDLNQMHLDIEENKIFYGGKIQGAVADSNEYLITYTNVDYYNLPECVFDCVWPGDANNNGFVDMSDLFMIGLSYINTGIARDSVSPFWLGYKVANWPEDIDGGLNTKFADTYGDGTIDENDTLGIINNYLETHPINTFRLSDEGYPLWLNTDGIVLTSGYNEIPIMLGTDLIPVDSIYAIEFNIAYDGPPVIDSNSVIIKFNDSWFGTTEELIQLDYNFPLIHNIDAGATNIDLTNKNGFGEIGRLGFIVEDNIAGILVESGDSTIEFTLNSPSGITVTNFPVTLTTAIFPIHLSSIAQTIKTNADLVYPNPWTEGSLYLKSQEVIQYYELINMNGNRVLKGDVMSLPVIIENLPEAGPGTYILKLVSQQAVYYNKLIIAN